MSLLVFGALLLLVSPAFAGKDAGAGNGGDICEYQFKIVRDDIASWIKKGGHLGLQLPSGLNTKQYEASMLNAISQAQVSCTDEALTIGGAEKTCKNFVDRGSPRIICNVNRYLNTDESSRYTLVHHEYAGLAGFEVNNGEDSNYSVSNQISGFLVDEVVKKLAVVAPSAQPVVPCSTLDRSKPIQIGVKCMTSRAAIFERVSRVSFGEAWKGPDGLVWSDLVDQNTYDQAVYNCKNLNGRLPTRFDFQRGELNGFREVLPNMTIRASDQDWNWLVTPWFWSSTVLPDDSSSAYTFFTADGMIGRYFMSREGIISIRCVGQ